MGITDKEPLNTAAVAASRHTLDQRARVYGADPNGDLRTMLNVGHGLEAGYAPRFQRALDAVLAIAEPHDTARPAYPAGTRAGSPYGHGFADGQRSLAGAVIAAMRTALFPDGPEA